MITATWLAEWAVRSSLLIALATLLPRILRVKDPSIRLAACGAAVIASLALPLFSSVLPKWPVFVIPAIESRIERSLAPVTASGARAVTPLSPKEPEARFRIDWGTAAVAIYSLVASGFLFRLAAGVIGARRLRRTAGLTELEPRGVEVRESAQVASPLTIGIVRPAIVLPVGWREWNSEKLDAVLAHECSHVERRDPALQFLSALHRALLWHSPLSWVLHGRIVRLAEEASDDAALAITRDRTSYAEIVLDFMRRGVALNWQGVAMARYGSPDDRIERILDSPMKPPGMTWKTAAAVVAIAAPLSYLTAAAIPSRAVQEVTGIEPANQLVVEPARAKGPVLMAQAAATAAGRSEHSQSRSIRRYMIFLENNQSGSWDSRDSTDPVALRAKFGQRFAWFRQGDTERVITDEAVLREIEQAMEPQNKVNRAQDRVNQLQSAVNKLQDQVNSQQNGVNAEQNKVNDQQNKVNDAQNQINRRQDVLNRIQSAGQRDNKEATVRELEKLLSELRAAPDGATSNDVHRLQSKVNELQDRVNQLQSKVNQEQNKVNQEQQKVNHEQHLVNEQQHQVSEEFNRRIQKIFESAIRNGSARPAR